ncbi:MAG: DUF2807 domain-containing protein [Chitinophagales bacterium]|nr:DUF2807 domain-containing protein [Bacteroidota bacterium]MCB9042372.1 DUF2807 domain-containing protein [Chitinophagales bacterium]
MDKTITINLNGIVYNITEEAYYLLQSYLETIRSHFRFEEGSEEILTDIEARIGEIFSENLKQRGSSVVTHADVNHTIDLMGWPEDFDMEKRSAFSQEQTNGTSANQNEYSGNTRQKRTHRLYLDEQNKRIAGVCAGISAYLGIEDPLWIRLLFVVLLFVSFGTMLFIYILLMVIVPPAKTPAEKLAMRGEPINISNLEKSFRENLKNVENSFSALSSSSGGMVNKIGNVIYQILKLVATVLFFLAKATVGLLGIALIVTFLVLLISLAYSLFTTFGYINDYFISSPFLIFLAWLCAFVLAAIPLALIAYFLGRFVLNMHYKLSSRAVGLMIIGWFAAAVMAGFLAFNFGSEFKNEANFEKSQTLYVSTDTLYIEMLGKQAFEDLQDSMNYGVNFGNLALGNGRILSDDISFNIEKNENPRIELIQTIQARGKTRKSAKELAANVQYTFSQQDTVLNLSPFFEINAADKWRNQSVDLTLKIPVGTAVFLSDASADILYNIDNVTNTYDHDMGNKIWLMTPNGLSCVSCPPPPVQESSERTDSLQIKNTQQQWISPPTRRLPNTSFVQTYPFTQFDALEIEGPFNVQIEQSEQWQVRVEGDKQAVEKISLHQNGDQLEITFEEDDSFWKNFWKNANSSDKVWIFIQTPKLKKVTASMAGKLYFYNLQQEELSVDLSGATKSNFENIQIEQLNLDLSGASDITLKGNVHQCDIASSGASSINALNMYTHNMNLDLSGASSADVNVSKQLSLSLSGASKVTYKGSPKIEKSNISGMSKVSPIMP